MERSESLQFCLHHAYAYNKTHQYLSTWMEVLNDHQALQDTKRGSDNITELYR